MNSSARIDFIEDVRAVSNPARGIYWTYSFQYADIVTGGVNYGSHLLSVTSHVAAADYNLYYYTIPSLNSPFGNPESYGSTLQLAQVVQSGTGLTHSFNYAASGSELTQIVFRSPVTSGMSMDHSLTRAPAPSGRYNSDI